MANPIATTNGICFAFPDILNTPTPPGGQVPMPYPNIAQLSAATANGKGIVRQFDPTDQNGGNAKGQVMVGFPTVLVGD